MDFSAAIETFVITLREGVEAALVVGIVLALLKQAKQTQLNSWVYGGIGVGLIASALVGVLFGWGTQALSASYPQYADVIEQSIKAIFSVMAITMLSWMLIWMTQQARFLKSEVEGAVTAAIQQGSGAGWGVFTLIFIAVWREGFEIVLFILAKFQQVLIPAVGAIAGIAVATGIGVLLFKWGVKINIRRFFQVMGVFLLLIVAGLVVSSLHHFDEAVHTLAQMDGKSENLCFFYDHFAENPSCILGPIIRDTSEILPQKKFPGIVLHAMFGYTQNLYLVQAVGYLVFLVTIGGIYFRSLGGSAVKVNQSAQKSVSSQ